jgi:hypothetical protein
MAKAAHFYARLRRSPIPHARLAHKGCGLVLDRDDDGIDVIALAPPQTRPETVEPC